MLLERQDSSHRLESSETSLAHHAVATTPRSPCSEVWCCNVQGSVQRLESSGEESNQALANRCKLDLAKAGFNVPAAPGTDEIKAGQ